MSKHGSRHDRAKAEPKRIGSPDRFHGAPAQSGWWKRRRRIFWLSFALVALAIATAYPLWRRGTTPRPPALAKSGLDRVVGALLDKTVAEVRASPRSGAAWGKLGMVLQNYDFKREARYCFAQAERFDPRQPRWPYFQGVLLASRDSRQAIDHLQRATELGGDQPDAPRLRLAQLLAEQGRLDDAERQFKELLRTQPNHAPALLGLARLSQARGQSEESTAYLRRCLTDHHTARSAYTLLAATQQRLANAAAAQTASRLAATLPPDEPWPDPFALEASRFYVGRQAWRDQAEQLLKQGRRDEAGLLISRLVTEYPDAAEGWLLLGRLRVVQKECPAAEQALRRVLAIDPTSVNGCVQLGAALLCQERYAEAAEVFQKAIHYKPDLDAAHFNLGYALAREGQGEAAIHSFREAIRCNPGFVDAYITLADLLSQVGQKAEAIACLRRAQDLNPSDDRARFLLERMQR
jgi:tetratricopeptide (TPR) repeat protein